MRSSLIPATLRNAGAACIAKYACTSANYPFTFGQYIGETAWNEFGSSAASGGGYSKIFGRPFYQDGVVSNAARGVPDIAYNAGVYTGVLVE